MAEWLLDNEAIEEYIYSFYGHGDYRAPYWFVGMEFGGGDTAAEVASHIQGWHDRGRHELEDLGGPKGIARKSRWFQPNYPLQATWKQLIRVLLTVEGKSATRDAIREYQVNRLGREAGADCILELLPLPSPGLNRWRFYPDTDIPYLKTRELYTRHVTPHRVTHLRQRIADYRPPAVIFYGKGYLHWWREIAGIDLLPSGLDTVSSGRLGDTLFVVMQHPAARGLSGTYFEAVGRLVAEQARLGLAYVAADFSE